MSDIANMLEIFCSQENVILSFNVSLLDIKLKYLGSYLNTLETIKIKQVVCHEKTYDLFYGIDDSINYIKKIYRAFLVSCLPSLNGLSTDIGSCKRRFAFIGEALYAGILEAAFGCTPINSLDKLQILEANYFELIFFQSDANYFISGYSAPDEESFSYRIFKSPIDNIVY